MFLGVKNEAKMVKHRGPGAFQQQTGSEEGPEAKKNPKAQKHPHVWEPFRMFFGADFQDISGTPFFRFFDKHVPKMGPKRGPFLRRWT